MLGWLFLPYRGAGVSFTSRLMRWHGEKFLGRPELLGLKNVLDDVKTTYYDLAVDRPIELHHHDLEAWSRGQQQAEEARQASRAEIPKATFLAVIAVCMGCALIAAPFSGSSDSSVNIGSPMVTGLVVSIKKKAVDVSIDRSKSSAAQAAAKPNKGFFGVPQVKQTPEEAAALRAECEEKWKTNNYNGLSDVRRCGTIWNEISEKELKQL